VISIDKSVAQIEEHGSHGDAPRVYSADPGDLAISQGSPGRSPEVLEGRVFQLESRCRVREGASACAIPQDGVDYEFLATSTAKISAFSDSE
jgi:hypothetical protein